MCFFLNTTMVCVYVQMALVTAVMSSSFFCISRHEHFDHTVSKETVLFKTFIKYDFVTCYC